jgi:predicted TIM-barrel fold metal-dependent hydrolase
MIIDVHSHWAPPCYTAALRREADKPGFGEARARLLESGLRPTERLTDLDIRMQEMDAAGVDVSVLSLPPPGVTVGDREVRREMASECNDEFLAAATRYPGRLLVMIAVPLPDIDDAMAEIERVGRHPAARGLNLQTVNQGWTLDQADLEPLYHLAAGLGLPVLAHPATEILPEVYDDFMLAATLAPMVSSSIGAARLAYSGLLDRVADLDVIVPHLGATLTYLIDRFDHYERGVADRTLRQYLSERFYFDTCSLHAPAMRCAIDTVGVERLMLGTDHPVRGTLDRFVQQVRDVVLDENDCAKVLGGTASRWFTP